MKKPLPPFTPLVCLITNFLPLFLLLLLTYFWLIYAAGFCECECKRHGPIGPWNNWCDTWVFTCARTATQRFHGFSAAPRCVSSLFDLICVRECVHKYQCFQASNNVRNPAVGSSRAPRAPFSPFVGVRARVCRARHNKTPLNRGEGSNTFCFSWESDYLLSPF